MPGCGKSLSAPAAQVRRHGAEIVVCRVSIRERPGASPGLDGSSDKEPVMADKHPTQAVPDAHSAASAGQRPDPSPTGRGAGGESGGGPYPNPHTCKPEAERDKGFGKHGGQSTIAYHGGGQLGEDEVTQGGNANSAAKGD